MIILASETKNKLNLFTFLASKHRFLFDKSYILGFIIQKHNLLTRAVQQFKLKQGL
jgi:hypothetical protein